MRAIFFLSLLAATATPAASADCVTLRERVQNTAATADPAAMKIIHAEAAQCDPTLSDWLGRRIAMIEYNAATAATPLDEARLVASLIYGRPWQTLATLGDLSSARKDRTAAARHYQDALVAINDPQLTPNAPPPNVINTVRKKAEVASLLSPAYVPMPKARDGSGSGLGALSLRGIAVVTTALPIGFVFGRAEFSAEGQKAVDEVVEMLRSRPVGKPVKLVGHTDAVGDPEFNRRLSLKRAESVRDYVVSRGVMAPIKVEGRGEDEPYAPDDVTLYSADELARMSRRVQMLLE